MASVPSIGCLLAKNQYYRKFSVSSVSSDTVNFKVNKCQQGFPKGAECTWWFKSFFHSESVVWNVRSKDLSSGGSLSGKS
ncbi:pancreatic progenitor cell differentiation and proliferation factor-like protein [Ochotona curzoniae]|uniref:pancreatic progenitor cell differentiation and proliferation factor-like protein n=1 Tax=Ochotona curzoniae TaxID=130825 RepID=UPI001B3505BF|nr:pancreatic progenitor cell differentiation and proliferation factor-like protein [Ochotona curzoniae]